MNAIPKVIGTWTALKLEYLDHYLQAYRTVTKKAPQSFYLDLFAGSGDCALRRHGTMVPGSAWRALSAVPRFTRYFFVEKDPEQAEHLRQRIRTEGISNFQVETGDCNQAVDRILPKVPRTALSFAFLDPSGLQLHWNTVKKLSSHRRGTQKMELLILYPYDMVINRWISKPAMSATLTAIHGGDSWRVAHEDSLLRGEDENARRERFVNSYRDKLVGLGYKYVDVYGPLKYGHRNLYNVLFAGDNPIGQRIMRDVWSKPRAIPGHLDYVPVPRPAQI